MRSGALMMALMGVSVAVAGGTSSASAASIVAVQNQEVLVPVNAELGSVLQFSAAVKTVTPAKSFAVSDLAGEATSTGQKTDVRTFQVKPIEMGANESVTFVLAGGRSVSLRLVATQNADKFYDVSLAVKRSKIGTKFMGAELDLMRSMIADEGGGFAREVLDTKVNADLGKLSVRLIRVYSAPELTGYVFTVANNSGSAMRVDAGEFSIGNPNRAVVSYASNENIEACPFFGTSANCTAMLQFVVRGTRESPPALSLSAKPAPFVKSESLLQGGQQ